MLTGLDQLDCPPCEVRKNYPMLGQYCGRPSVARVTTRCGVHGLDGPFFLCRGDLDNLQAGALYCKECMDENRTTVSIMLERFS